MCIKKLNFSKNMRIGSQQQLIEAFHSVVRQDPDLNWSREANALSNTEGIVLNFDGRALDFVVKYRLYPGEEELDKVREGSGQPLLVVPCLNDRLLQRCKDVSLSVIDLNGQAWIRSKGVLIDRGPVKGRNYRYDLEPRNIFVGKSERIVRALLTDRDREWTQSELAERAKASSGLLSRVTQYLLKQGYVAKTGSRTFKLNEELSLLDDWVDADRMDRRTRLRRYSGIGFDSVQLEEKVESWAEGGSVKLAFTQWVAAWQRHGYTEPEICSAYVSRHPASEELERFGFREVPDAGNLRLYIPEDEGVFLEAWKPLRLPVVSDAQIYVDLQNTGLRGPEAAQALREWEGFCRP